MLISMLGMFSMLLVFDLFSLMVFFLGLSLVVAFLYGGSFEGVCYVDTLSLFLIFVTVWVLTLSVGAMDLGLMGSFVFWLMLFFIIFSFLGTDYLFFYVSFEVVFLLMFFFLLGWGKMAERFQASFYMFFYTLVFSFPFLLMLVQYKFLMVSSFFLLPYFSYNDFLWVFMMLVFMVKFPLFGLHLWLPKAHVEAPVSGSMLLAGVLLKLGGYGLIRFLPSLCLVSFSSSFLLSFFFYISLFGFFIVSLISSRQSDLKMMIAYSSIVHMSVSFLGILSFTYLGSMGAVLMMVAHGFISSFLFYSMNEGYSLFHSRSILILKGFLASYPLFVFFWFLGCFLNLSVPPFMSFFSELLIFGSMSFLWVVDWGFIFLGLFFTGVYCTYMYSTMSHGLPAINLSFFSSLKFFLFSFSHFYFVLVYPFLFFCF